jgi:hypothetical protein
MPLPLTRNRTYGSGDPIDSGDLNELQDCPISGARGSNTENYHLGAAALTAATVNGSGQVQTSGSGAALLYTLRAWVGDTLTGAKLRASGNGTVDILHARVWRSQADGTLDDLGDTPISNVGATWTTYALAFTAPIEVAEGDSFFAEIVWNAAALLLTTFGLTSHHDLP